MEAKFFRFLKIVGVGFKARAESEGRLLFLKLGYSHEVELTVPPAVRVFCFKPNVVCCTGIDKQRVHQFAAAVRSCKPPEVYKGKGIMYIDEVIKKKQGKKSKWLRYVPHFSISISSMMMFFLGVWESSEESVTFWTCSVFL